MVRKRIYRGHSLVKNVDDYTVLDIETTSMMFQILVFHFLW